jgi:hypothetical protein
LIAIEGVFDVLSLSDTSLFLPFCSNWKGRDRCAFAARAVCLLRVHLVDAPACTKMGRLSLCVVFRLISFCERDRERKRETDRDRQRQRQRDRVAEPRTVARAVFSPRAHTRRRVSFLHARARLEVLVSFRTRGHCGKAVSWARVAVKGMSAPPGRERAVHRFGLSPDMVPIDGVP